MRKVVVKAWMTLDGVFDTGSMDQWFNPFHSDERAASISDTV